MRPLYAAAATSCTLLLSLIFAAGCGNDESGAGPEPVSPTVSALRKPDVPAADRIPDEYVVTFRSEVPDAPGRAKTLAAREHARLLQTYTHGVHGFAAHMSSAAAERIAADP